MADSYTPPDDYIDMGHDPNAMTCPICAGPMHRFTKRSPFDPYQRTNILKCVNEVCPFGETKSYKWYEHLLRSYNNREDIKEICVHKDCEQIRVVRISPFCPRHEGEYGR